jgi:bifunctional oligoribonuclease and PAP phosphatase NrnA
MFSADKLQVFKEKIDAANKIAIFGHHGVDGDAVGAMLGLGLVLEKLDKKVEYFTTVLPSKSFSFVKGIEKIQVEFSYGEYDLIIFVDFTGYNRISWITKWHEEYFDNANLIVIDHHIDDEFMQISDKALIYKDIDASSCCEIILEMCDTLWPSTIDSVVATHLYMGLVTDTGWFQFEQDSVKTFTHAINLIKHGADKAGLIEHLFNSSPISLIEFMKLVIPRIRIMWHVCSIRYTLEELEELWLTQEQAESVMFFIRSIYGVAVYAEIRVASEYIKISLRSWYTDIGRANVQKIALTLGGGGHQYASGCGKLKDPSRPIEEQIQLIIEHLNNEVLKQF